MSESLLRKVVDPRVPLDGGAAADVALVAQSPMMIHGAAQVGRVALVVFEGRIDLCPCEYCEYSVQSEERPNDGRLIDRCLSDGRLAAEDFA